MSNRVIITKPAGELFSKHYLRQLNVRFSTSIEVIKESGVVQSVSIPAKKYASAYKQSKTFIALVRQLEAGGYEIEKHRSAAALEEQLKEAAQTVRDYYETMAALRNAKLQDTVEWLRGLGDNVPRYLMAFMGLLTVYGGVEFYKAVNRMTNRSEAQEQKVEDLGLARSRRPISTSRINTV